MSLEWSHFNLGRAVQKLAKTAKLERPEVLANKEASRERAPLIGRRWDQDSCLSRSLRIQEDPLHFEFRSAVRISRPVSASLPSKFVFGP